MASRFNPQAFSSRESLVDAWGDFFLTGNGCPPDWWVTVTLADDCGDWGGVRRFGAFCAELRRRLGHRAEWVRVTEHHKHRLTPHYHCLMWDCRDCDGIEPGRVDLQNWTWDSIGKTTIERFDPALGAPYYAAKYVSKDAHELRVDFSRNWGRGSQ